VDDHQPAEDVEDTATVELLRADARGLLAARPRRVVASRKKAQRHVLRRVSRSVGLVLLLLLANAGGVNVFEALGAYGVLAGFGWLPTAYGPYAAPRSERK
jgi:hypothetical protein